MLSLATISPLAFRAPVSALRMTAELQPQTPPEVTTPIEEVLPAIKTMRVGDGTLAGDMNFDPLGLSGNPASLAWYREAEIKHARLAMLAAFGWPVSELTNFGNLLNPDGRAPSLLNGGLENINVVYWVGVIGVAVFWEGKGLDKQFGKKDTYLPGMLGFDPLGADSPSMRNAEITNGRVAMLAITAYALEEAILKAPIFPLNLVVTAPGPITIAAQAASSVASAATAAADGTFDLGEFFPVPEPVAAPVVEAVGAVADAAGEAVAAVAPVGEIAQAVASGL